MSIIFGWYSFKIKSYKPDELGYADERLPGTTFEVRQKVFHLFWIPAFSLGKTYVVRKHDVLFDIPEEQKKLLKSKGQHRTPWYSYSLPFLLVAGYFSFLGYEKYKAYDRKHRRKVSFEQSIMKLDREFSRLDTNCYLKLRDPNNYSYSTGTYLKLVEVNGQMVNGKLLQTGLADYQKNAVKSFYLRSDHDFKTYTLSLEEIKNGICRDLHKYNNYSCPGVNLLQDENHYYIESVERF